MTQVHGTRAMCRPNAPARPWAPTARGGSFCMLSDIQRLIALPSLDSEYRFGKPKRYLTAHELARLTVLRSKLGETRQEREAGGRFMSDVRHTRLPVNVRLRGQHSGGQLVVI